LVHKQGSGHPPATGPLAEFKKAFFSKGLGQEPSPELALGRMAIKDFSNQRVLERLLMYERRLEHSLYKTLIELQRLNLIKNLNPDTVTQLKQFSNYQATP
jgi:hypothetical protein